MSISIAVKFDDRQLQAYIAEAKQILEKNLRSTIDRTARQARRDAIKVMARDLNVAVKDFRKAVPLVKGTRPGKLIATWTVGKADNFIRKAGGGKITHIVRGEAIPVSTFAVSGGGSAALTLSKGFTIPVGGKQLVMIRLGPGKSNIRPVYAGRPSTDMQGNRAAEKAWTMRANLGMQDIGRAVQAALNLASSPAPTSADDGGV